MSYLKPRQVYSLMQSFSEDLILTYYTCYERTSMATNSKMYICQIYFRSDQIKEQDLITSFS